MSDAAGIVYTMHDELLREDAAIIDAGLGLAADAAAPLHDVHPLCCFARAASGRVLGGAVGRTWGACCELQQLWVEPEHRRQGIGARLVREFERNAEIRGCRTFYLYTFSFQAPGLYRALGYVSAFELRGFPSGIVKHTMVREVACADSDAGRSEPWAPRGDGPTAGIDTQGEST